MLAGPPRLRSASCRQCRQQPPRSQGPPMLLLGETSVASGAFGPRA